MAPLNPFSLRKQLAFYGAYHTNHVNVSIHIIGVPSIIFSVCILLARTSSLHLSLQRHLPLVASYLSLFWSHVASLLPASLVRYARLDASAIFMATYFAYYTILDPVAATLLAPLWYTLYHTAETVAHTVPNATSIGAAIFVAGWIAQFYGHGVYEKRAPALLDNLLGAVVLAPFFVWLECIFQLGYRPELQEQLKNDVGALVVKFRREQAKLNKEKRG
ncbi:hypothetical protein ACQY0O_005400 [Thecaphora frezii]